MTIGTSLILIAVGAILRYAVADSWEAIDLTTVGLILIIVGIVGFIVGLIQMASWNRARDDAAADRRDVPRDRAV